MQIPESKSSGYVWFDDSEFQNGKMSNSWNLFGMNSKLYRLYNQMYELCEVNGITLRTRFLKKFPKRFSRKYSFESIAHRKRDSQNRANWNFVAWRSPDSLRTPSDRIQGKRERRSKHFEESGAALIREPDSVWIIRIFEIRLDLWSPFNSLSFFSLVVIAFQNCP